jgi:hypothetical protein
MRGLRCSGLLRLLKQRPFVRADERTNTPMSLQDVSQRIASTGERSAADLHQRPIEGGCTIERGTRPYNAVASDHRRFYDLGGRDLMAFARFDDEGD